MTNNDKIKHIKKVLSYLFIKKKVYWINRIAGAHTLDGKYDIACKVKIDDLGGYNGK
jgi:uncharacterized protein involved in tellurium resistance